MDYCANVCRDVEAALLTTEALTTPVVYFTAWIMFTFVSLFAVQNMIFISNILTQTLHSYKESTALKAVKKEKQAFDMAPLF